MRRYGKPLTEAVLREFLPLDLALYSIWMPGDVTTASIQSTTPNPVRTYDELIELDDVHEACVAFLVRAGTPVFTDVKAQEAYTHALEDQLRGEVPPAVARAGALRACGLVSTADGSAT